MFDKPEDEEHMFLAGFEEAMVSLSEKINKASHRNKSVTALAKCRALRKVFINEKSERE